MQNRPPTEPSRKPHEAHDPDTALSPHDKMLKAIVVILGVLIVVALGALIYGIATRTVAHVGNSSESTETSYSATVQAPHGYYVIAQNITAGYLTVTFENDEGGYIWRIYDLANGALLGTIKSARQ